MAAGRSPESPAVNYLRLRPQPARQLLEEVPEVVAFRTEGIGYLGAVGDDQARWSSGFRRLLDALGGPLQVVLRFRPGDSEGVIAQRREVLLVTGSVAGPSLKSALVGLGLTVTEGQLPDASHTFGERPARSFRDRFGWHRTWYIDNFPGGKLEPGWLLRLIPSGLAVDLAWHAEPVGSGWATDYLQRQLAHLRASQLDGERRGIPDVRIGAAVPAAVDLQRKLSAGQERAFHLAAYLTLTAPDRECLEAGAARVIEVSRAALCELREATLRQFEGRLATLALGTDRLRRRHLVDTSAVVTLLPWLDVEVADPEGLRLGRSRATSRPVVVDPFSDRHHENANIAVFGHSGAGKTYLLKTLALAATRAGCQVFVIDPEHEYGPVATAVGGADVQLALGSGHALNVMDMRGLAREEAELGPAVADTVDLVATVCSGLDETEKAVLEAAIRQAYLECSAPVLADVALRLPPTARVARVLTRWVRGSLGAMFSAPTNVDLDLPMVVFGMRELREELVGPVHFLLAEALWRRFRERTRRRLLIVDELGLLFEDPVMRRFVVRLARRIRKYNGSLVFATQNAGDLLGSEAGLVVATNPALRFFGAQRPGEAPKLQQAFQLSDVQRQGLESARRGEFLLAAGHRRLEIQVEAEPSQEALIKAHR
jgi:KaiC/GvpD/RAD55 family RecA-like ATPase